MAELAQANPTRRRKWLGALMVLLVGLGGIGALTWYKLFRVVAVHYDSPLEHFKYGSVGVEAPAGIPYWIWMVLPRIFPDKLDKLGGGYLALGASWEEGQELPIGFSKVTVGFPRVGVNCAGCHTTSVRAAAGEKPTFYFGGPANRFRPQDYLRFLFDCARDPRFNSDTILREIGRLYQLSWLDRLLYRYLIVPQTKRALLQTEQRDYYWMAGRPDWGPGRTDLNAIKLMVLRLPDDGTIGSTDVMPIWNQRQRQGLLHHWDGLNTTLTESVRTAALAAGASLKSIDLDSLSRLEQWMLDLCPPPYPFSIDSSLSSTGEKIYDRDCASCHTFGRARTGTAIPLAELGTDPNRNLHWSQAAADAFNRFASGKPWAFHNFRRSEGYVATALDGLWLRAPYLHNGSVPTLKDLLEPPENRPRVFFRGYDVYDPVKVGFVSNGPQAETEGFRYDTGLKGNGKEGHLYGTALSVSEKRALLEYLKTL